MDAAEVTELELCAPQAEAALIGAVGHHADTLAAVLARLPGSDFYNPHRGYVWDACRALADEREPIDPTRVARRLASAEQWNEATAGIVNRELLDGGPADFAGRNADHVADLARRRELMQAVSRVRRTVLQHPGDVTEVLSAVRAEFDAIDDPERMPQAGGTLGWDQLIAEFRAAQAPEAKRDSIPTPWHELDSVLGGLFGGRMYVFGGRPGQGKALALDTPIPTPSGWTTMGAVEVGDQVLGADGKPTTVTTAWDVRHGRPCFEVEFSDGSIIVADAEHQWLTETRASRKSGYYLRGRDATRGTSPFSRDQRHRAVGASVVTTEQIAATLRVTADRRLNHSIPTCAPLALPDTDLLIPPYTLGVWLGDGTSAAAAFTSADPEIAMHIEAEGLRVAQLATRMRYAIKLPEQSPTPTRNCAICGGEVTSQWTWVQTCTASCAAKFRHAGGQRRYGTCTICAGPATGSVHCQRCWAEHGSITARLRTIGVLDNKHIPAAYLRASEPQRRALLAGLLDTDGTVTPAGQAQFCVTSERLALDFYELAVSLGYRVAWTAKPVKGRSVASSTAYVVSFSTADDVFRLERKRLLHKERRRTASESRSTQRYIVDVRRVPSVPVRCVEVDNADHLYLAGQSMIPTHNSTAALNIAAHAAIDGKSSVLVISKEMPSLDVTGRVLARGAEVDLKYINSRSIDNWSMREIDKYINDVGRPKFAVDARPRKLAGVKALARTHHHRVGLDMLVVDYLQLVRTDTPSRTREQEVAQVSMELKALALELDCVVVVPAQLNRGSLQRADPKPTMSDLRDSGQIEQDSDVVTLLHRERADDGTPTGKILFIVDKNRHGPTAEFKLDWRGGYGAIA